MTHQTLHIFDTTLQSIESVLYGEPETPHASRLQFHPQAKILFMISMLISSAVTYHPIILLCHYVIVCIMSLISGVAVKALMRVVFVLPFFALWIAIPMVFLIYPHDIHFFHIFSTPLSVSIEGAVRAMTFVLRIMTSVTIVTYVVRTTEWNAILKSLRAFHIPDIFISILAMTYRYIYVLLRTTSSMIQGRSSRTFRKFSYIQSYQLLTGILSELFIKSMTISENVYLAMISRGYHGVELSMDTSRLKTHDFLFIYASIGYAVIGIIVNQIII